MSENQKYYVLCIVSCVIFFSPKDAFSDYVTREFQQGDSHIALSYICGVVGHKTKLAPDAFELVARFMKDQVSVEHSANLTSDALTWWESEHEMVNLQSFWEINCAKPIDNLRRFLQD